MRTVQPGGWLPPKGYANGVAARGEVLLVAGQIAWNERQEIVSDDFVLQFDQALANVVAVVEAAGGKPTDVARMTVYVTDMPAYRAAGRALGERWRARFGKHFPAMALVGVTTLVEPRAKVEIEATAILQSEG
jgi:enamine deaminase RidA (YjgF/YER057c/UK114 family)